MQSKRTLITSALPYANGPLHFGHLAGAYLPADCYARYLRARGRDVLYLCGSDEHGVAITLSARLAGHSPQKHVDHYHKVLKGFFDTLNISFDHYSRTTAPIHAEQTCAFFEDLLKNGYIEEKETEQLYSEEETLFLADRYVMGTCPKCGFDKARGDECGKCGASYEATDLKNPVSKLSGKTLIKKPTTHWFLRFDKFKEKLSKWLATKKWKPNVANFVQNYIDDLKERAITRDSDWGIPVPLENAEGKVFYVWFDAPIGYISAAIEWAEKSGDKDAWKKYWCDEETKLVHFIGKDNIPFHAIFFPAMIMGQDEPYKLVDELPANEFYNLEGKQFSKSEGWTIDLERFFKNFSADQIRYTIAANAPETQDSEFTWHDFQQRCNGDLCGKFGNLANRVLTFTRKQCNEKSPSAETDPTFMKKLHTLANEAATHFEQFSLRKATQTLMEIAAEGNRYFDEKAPWTLKKDPEKREEMEAVLMTCLECLKTLTAVAQVIIPESAEKLWAMLGFTKPLKEASWDIIIETPFPQGQSFPKPEILFKRVEDEIINAELEELKIMNTKM